MIFVAVRDFFGAIETRSTLRLLKEDSANLAGRLLSVGHELHFSPPIDVCN
jgi:hypothetical protein